MDIRLAIFDVNETLCDFNEIKKRFKKIGLNSFLCDLWFSNVLKEGFALSSLNYFVPFKKIGENQLQKILKKKDIKNIEESVEFILDGFKELNAHDDVKKAFQILHKKKVKIVTLTNGNSITTKILLKKNKLEKFVVDCFSVDDVKIWKPFKEPYLNVVNYFNLNVNNVIMIAAHSWDIAGAQNAGLFTGYISRFEGTFHSYLKKPNFSSNNLIEMSNMISKMIK